MAFYLHGLSSDPFAYESEMSDVVSARISAMGVTTIIPLVSKGCIYLDVPLPDARCWDLWQA